MPPTHATFINISDKARYNLMMRIITGKAKGIRLKTLEGDATRPTSERVKEAVFSMIQGDVEGREVLDIFAGSGQMGLEAVSRGAVHATMIDSSPLAVKIISENAEKTHLSSQCTIRRMEYMDFIRRNVGQKYDIVFLDPPYAAGFYRPALKSMLESDMLKTTSLIICESDTDIIFGEDKDLAGKFRIVKQSRYSRTFITILSPEVSL